jgi:transposase
LGKDIKQIVKGLLRVAEERPLLFKEDIQNERVQEYGLVYVVQKLWAYLEMGETLSKSLKAQKVQLDYERWIKMMVTNKLSDPTSKLGILEWLKGVWWPNHGFDPHLFKESLAPEEQEKLLKKEVMKFYRALDHLLKLKKPLEKHLYLRLRDLFSLKVDLVFYDVTSSYFEGEPELETQEIIQAYRDLAEVEEAFRTMKSVLDLRPFFHRTADRVRAHLFIWVLAYLLQKLVEKAPDFRTYFKKCLFRGDFPSYRGHYNFLIM